MPINNKLKRVLVQDQVYEEMKDLIINGTWEMGEKLPSENELSEMFGVNRLTIRLAIQKLNTIGITETQVGKGTYVIDFNMDKYVSQISSFLIKPDIIDDILRFRRLIEVDSANLAIEKNNQEDLVELKHICDRYTSLGRAVLKNEKNQHSEEFMDLVNEDYNFHKKVVEMSENKMYIHAYSLIKEALMQYFKGIIIKRKNTTPEVFLKNIDMHEELYEAIRDRDFEATKKIYEDIIDYRKTNE
ncbi:FadR/GntR family transcriptional regulator [Amphibacillus sp. Q70]|uniref:FadR/GntR family transcriptional regulator n=1 Tax=Amphibacillus sp. Q70 TaxID=3453416 RepID=UPI003F832F8D